MEFTGSYTLKGDIQKVWELMVDPDAIAKAVPGVKAMTPVEGETDTWRAEAKIGFSAISGNYAGIIHMTDRNPPNSYRLNIKGEGQQSHIQGHAEISLTYDAAAGTTTVAWDAHADIAGKLARIGQRVIKAAANFLARQFFGNLAKQLDPNAVVEATAEDEPTS
jgi:hypothetical protein